MTTNTRRRGMLWGMAAAVVVAGGALAGCGSDDDGGSASTAASSADGGDQGTIQLRAIAAVGSGLTNYPDVEAGAKAAVKSINDAGGVNGRTIELSFCNTRGEANEAVKCSRGAVSDGVAAVVGRVDIFSPQSTPVLEKAGVPLIGNLQTTGDADGESPVSYPLNSGNYGSFTATPYAFKEGGRKKMAIVMIDLASGLQQAKVVEQVAKNIGMESVGVIKVPAQGVTDFSPYAQQIKDRGADSAFVALGPQAGQALFKAVDALGIDVQIAGTVFSYGESEGRAMGKAAEGIWALSPFPSLHDDDNPGIKRFHEELDAAGIDDDLVLRRAAGLNAWLAVYAAAEAAKKVDGDVTAESMTAALKETRNVDLHGLATWSPADLGTDGTFARLSPSEYRVLEFAADGKLDDSGMKPIADPLQTVR